MGAHHQGMVPEQVSGDGAAGCTATLEVHWTVMVGMCTTNPIQAATRCKSCPVPGEYIFLRQKLWWQKHSHASPNYT